MLFLHEYYNECDHYAVDICVQEFWLQYALVSLGFICLNKSALRGYMDKLLQKFLCAFISFVNPKQVYLLLDYFIFLVWYTVKSIIIDFVCDGASVVTDQIRRSRPHSYSIYVFILHIADFGYNGFVCQSPRNLL